MILINKHTSLIKLFLLPMATRAPNTTYQKILIDWFFIYFKRISMNVLQTIQLNPTKLIINISLSGIIIIIFRIYIKIMFKKGIKTYLWIINGITKSYKLP